MSAPRKASLAVIFGIVVLDLLGFGIVIPQLGIYAVQFQASPLTVGLLQSVFSLMQFAFAPYLGRLSDRFGRRPVLLLSVLGSLTGYILFAFAGSLEMLFLARIIDGISGANISTAQAYIADVTTPENRARGMGLVGAAFGIGFLFGPAVGGILGSWGGNWAIGLGAGGLCLLNLILAFFFLPESLTEEARGKISARTSQFSSAAFFQRLQVPVLGQILILFFVFTVAFAQMEGTLSVFALKQHLVPQLLGASDGFLTTTLLLGQDARLKEASLQVGYLFASVGLVAVVVQGALMGRLRSRFSEASLAWTGMILATLGICAIPLAPNFAFMFPAAMVMAVGSGLTNPTLSALLSIQSPKDRQGEMLGAYQSMGALGRILGPAIGGALFTFVSAPAPYWVAGLFLAGGALLAARLRSTLKVMGTHA